VRDPKPSFDIDRVSAEIGAVPAGNACVGIRIGDGVFRIGWIVHDVHGHVTVGCEGEKADRVLAERTDGLAVLWCVDVTRDAVPL
jgi:hypothetical protein